MSNNSDLKFLNCPNCNKKFFKSDNKISTIEIVCPGCGAEVRIESKKIMKINMEVLNYN